MKHEEFDLEGQLRAGRSAPRAEFAETVADGVRSAGPSRSPRLSVGSALALTGLIVVAIASFGGIGYASSHPAKQPAKVWVVKGPSSAAAAQYGTTSTTTTVSTQQVAPTKKPVTKLQTKGTKATSGTQSAKGALSAPKAKSAQLPFTGLSLWVPLAIGLMLISLGLVLRTRGRRRNTAQ